jgi:hypothetical protein
LGNEGKAPTVSKGNSPTAFYEQIFYKMQETSTSQKAMGFTTSRYGSVVYIYIYIYLFIYIYMSKRNNFKTDASEYLAYLLLQQN